MRVRCSFMLVALLMLLGCGMYGESNMVAEFTEVESSGWNTPSTVCFEVTDTLSRFDMSLLLRYDSYVSSNAIELFVSTTAPNGVMWSEQITFNIAATKRSIAVAEVPLRNNIRWNQVGEYKVELLPQHLYKGVLAAGVNLAQRE
ncbi:MAG: hypothetical protein R3Y08_05565 [Rikenellaceae bacterium]